MLGPRSPWVAGASDHAGGRWQESGASSLGSGGSRRRIGWSAASHSGVRTAFPPGIDAAVATPGGQGRGVDSHLAPNPYRALGEGGRYRHGPSRWCATGDPATEPQDLAALVDEQEIQCAPREAQSAHRNPMSFAHSGTAVSRVASIGWHAWEMHPLWLGVGWGDRIAFDRSG